MEQTKSAAYRRLFIMRKDLKMSPGKLAAQVAHCAEAYWTRLIQNHSKPISDSDDYLCCTKIQGGIFTEYFGGTYTKTICEARNKKHLLKARPAFE